MPSTITWRADALSQAGGALIQTEQGCFLAHSPKRQLILPPSTRAWEELKRFIDGCSGVAIGMIGYEMGAFADLDYPLPYHAPDTPALIFYEPTYFEKVELPPATLSIAAQLSECSDTLATYLEKIEAIRECIGEGDVYQVNLSQAFTFTHQGLDPVELFLRLYERNRARYGAYLNCGDHQIASLSPELFIQRRGDRLVTRPIKGTAPRGQNEISDRGLKEQLIASEKDQAELLMITDLMRNDLTRVCTRGSVHVDRLWELESHPDVFHLVSTITGQSTAHSVDIVRALFPAGSITGCPKRAAIETIHAIEGRARGVYTGAIGIFEPSGDFSFNVAIRTLTMDLTKITVQLGGAILYDSEGQKEYDETLHKGRTFFELLR